MLERRALGTESTRNCTPGRLASTVRQHTRSSTFAAAESTSRHIEIARHQPRRPWRRQHAAVLFQGFGLQPTSTALEASTRSSLACGRVLSTSTACSAFAGSGMSSTYTASPVTCPETSNPECTGSRLPAEDFLRTPYKGQFADAAAAPSICSEACSSHEAHRLHVCRPSLTNELASGMGREGHLHVGGLVAVGLPCAPDTGSDFSHYGSRFA